MSNFPLLRANFAAWSVGSALEPTEAWAFDEDRTKTINATDGSTHAPTSPIVIGGDGIYISGPAEFDDMTIRDSATVTVANEAVITVEDDASIEIFGSLFIRSGGDLFVNAGGDVSVSGTLTFASGTWPALNSRTLTLRAPAKIVGGSGGVSSSLNKYWSFSGMPVVKTATRDASGGLLHLEIPLGPNGSTLTTVRVWTAGGFTPGGGTLVRPTYRVQSLDLSGSGVPAVSNVSSLVTDAHASDASDWVDWVETSITGIAGVIATDTHIYWLLVNLPYNVTSGEEQDMYVLGIEAVYTITQLRP